MTTATITPAHLATIAALSKEAATYYTERGGTARGTVTAEEATPALIVEVARLHVQGCRERYESAGWFARQQCWEAYRDATAAYEANPADVLGCMSGLNFNACVTQVRESLGMKWSLIRNAWSAS